MRLEPLYLLRFTYPEEWDIPLSETDSLESQSFFLATGQCEGRITGSLRGANHPHRRTDGTYEPNFQGVIETDDGATIYFDMTGYGRAYPIGRRQIVACTRHLSSDPRYRWLNDTIAVSTGEVRSHPDRPVELVVETAELIWERPNET